MIVQYKFFRTLHLLNTFCRLQEIQQALDGVNGEERLLVSAGLHQYGGGTLSYRSYGTYSIR